MVWNDVKNALPPEKVDVLVFHEDGHMSVSCFFYVEMLRMWTWEERDDQVRRGEVTHWMPLPEGPI